jgi:hypothetical protein
VADKAQLKNTLDRCSEGSVSCLPAVFMLFRRLVCFSDSRGLLYREPSDIAQKTRENPNRKLRKTQKMKNQAATALAVMVIIAVALFINVSNATAQTPTKIQSTGTITQGNTQGNSAGLTVILRDICITNLNQNQMNIAAWVDGFVASHSYADAVTISDMHAYGVLWFGYGFSQTQGTWMGWTFSQLQTLLNEFHKDGWKVGIETTAVAWEGQQEYNYITRLHPELAYTNANGQTAAVNRCWNKQYCSRLVCRVRNS